MKRCVEVVTLAVRHFFVDSFMPSYCSNSSRRADRGILDLMRVLDGCGRCIVSYLVGGDNSDQVFTSFKAVELSRNVVVIIFILNRS